MKRILSVLYTLATVLIIIGALFILQSESYGISLLTGGLALNIIYRLLTTNWELVKNFKISELLKLVGVVIMILACVLVFTDSNHKFNFLILAVILDLVLNFKEISFKTK